MAYVELFLKPEQLDVNPEWSPEEEILHTEVRQAAELAEEAGMPELARRHRARLVTPAFIPGGQKLTSEEYETWRRWLPTSYRMHPRPHSAQRNWNEYAYDAMTHSVLKLIVTMKPMVGTERGFDELEIRTPERARVNDPALFGHRGESVWLLARWGESDERVASFAEIQAGLAAIDKVDSLHGSAWDDWFPVAMLTVLVTGGGAILAAVLTEHLGLGLTPSLLVCAALVISVVSWVIQKVQRTKQTIAELTKKFAYAFNHSR